MDFSQKLSTTRFPAAVSAIILLKYEVLEILKRVGIQRVSGCRGFRGPEEEAPRHRAFNSYPIQHDAGSRKEEAIKAKDQRAVQGIGGTHGPSVACADQARDSDRGEGTGGKFLIISWM